MNTEAYYRNAASIGALFPPTWAEEADLAARAEEERLEASVAAARASMAKEQARRSYTDLGKFLHRRGDLNGALKALLRTRDYCSSPLQVFFPGTVRHATPTLGTPGTGGFTAVLPGQEVLHERDTA